MYAPSSRSNSVVNVKSCKHHRDCSAADLKALSQLKARPLEKHKSILTSATRAFIFRLTFSDPLESDLHCFCPAVFATLNSQWDKCGPRVVLKWCKSHWDLLIVFLLLFLQSLPTASSRLYRRSAVWGWKLGADRGAHSDWYKVLNLDCSAGPHDKRAGGGKRQNVWLCRHKWKCHMDAERLLSPSRQFLSLLCHFWRDGLW